MPLTIDIAIEDGGWDRHPYLERWTREAVDACLLETDAAPPDGSELSLLLCGDARMRGLNRDFRGLDKPTNVLSFPAPPQGPGPRPLGDIAIAYETVVREAEEERKSLHDHYAHMVAHGLLHILGYDHEADGEAEAMEALERRILKRLGIADPYAANDRDTGQH